MAEIIKCLGDENMKLHLAKPSWSSIRQSLTRRKTVNYDEDSRLSRVLSTLDLTLLGVGSTLGVGVYVLAGDVAKNTAGPAVTISFFIAAVASVLAGLCYAEFGARVPKAGSAYVYSYVCIGEFFAFIIGWNLVLEYLIGSATVTKAIFLYIDKLANNTMMNYFKETMPMAGDQISSYCDIFSLGLSLVFSVALAFGAKESSWLNNIFTLVNITVVLIVIISGFWKVNSKNWSVPKEEVVGDYGNGGFAPYGVEGIIKGAARCFFGFIGFDCIATAGEEAKNPKKSIPIGVVLSLLIVFLAYFGMSTVLTMMLPYYEQDENAPLPHVYDQLGWTAIKYIVSVGAMCGLFSSLLGAMFPLPRIIYAMAADGLLFKKLSSIHPKFKTPFMGTLIAGACTGVLACLLDLDKLVEMMSIGTLLAYSMVAACVLVLRYESDDDKDEKVQKTASNYVKQLFNSETKLANSLTSSLVSWIVFVYFAVSFLMSGMLTLFDKELYRGEWWIILAGVGFFIVLMGMLWLISRQPTSGVHLSFKVPLVPWIPGISILVNVYLMTNIKADTWVKYTIWMVIGLVIYFTYGIWSSKEGKPKSSEIDDESSIDTK
ncbi:cationic amino acid transporter 2 isoform X3 [Aethina tumida]|uniref:cationic amino acid transporter 2 isoform X3 n=1 Tax=Aethina tumida TaxID=116153 RepID=UPI002148E41F|nr:cationic amino acid transporter 2 isoform X3 [Aethina tumida]